jgi:uncharacterized protein
MRLLVLSVCVIVIAGLFAASSQPGPAKSDFPVTPVSFKDVQVTNGFWAPWLERTRTVTLPSLLDTAARPGGRGIESRVLEAAAYFLASRPDPALRARIDQALDPMIERLRAQKQKWPNTGDGPFHGVGMFFQSAVAYYEATGSRKLLDAAIEIADDIDSVYGPGKRRDIGNHEGIKMGLVSLYRATKNEKYLKLATFFLDERGNWKAAGRPSFGDYAQDTVPVKQQTRAMGHSVRATYLYGPLTDIAALTADREYAQTVNRIWEDAVGKRTYLTGGIGSYRHEENYSFDDYDLPNMGCWNEICAACGNVWWNHKMFLLNQDARYIDVMERILYNGLLTGVSVKGDTFLYQAPLKTYGDFARQARFGPNCCPPNITRLLASVGGLLYAYDDRGLYVNLFAASKAQIKLKQTPVSVDQQTQYPWEGSTKVVVNPERPEKFAVFMRIPGWARNEAMPGLLYRFMAKRDGAFRLTVNGRTAAYTLERGYARIERAWAKGDTIELNLPMPVQKVLARDEVADDRGMVSLQRGPLVYCAEGVDNGGKVFNLLVPDNAEFQFAYRKDLLNGVGTLTGKVQALSRGADRVSVNRREQDFMAIPYYAFANRGTGEMAVWLARQQTRVELPPVPTIASTSRATSSSGNGTVAENYPGNKPPTIAQRLYPNTQDGSGDIRAIYDQLEPVNSEDASSYYLRLHPQSGDQAWVQYDFAKSAKVSSVDVYWKDDKQYCPAPRSWRLLYKDGDAWKPVNAKGSYGVEKDKFNTLAFDPITTSGLRIEIQLQGKTYQAGKLGPPDANWMRADTTWYEGGVVEWRVNP